MMAQQSLRKAAVLMVLMVCGGIIGWETYLRSTDFDIAFDDGGPLWAHQRAKIYQAQNEATIFIGSSRIKFDLDLDVWKELTGENAIQLACVGSSPRSILNNLALDPEFNGKLVIDVTEGLFFSTSPQNFTRPAEGIKYYKDITPAQKVSFLINKPLESGFVFLDKSTYSLNAMLEQLEIQSRPGVSMMPIFARDFGRVKFNRQEYLGKRFLQDTNQQIQQKKVWALFGKMNTAPPINGASLDSIISLVKDDIDKIRERGGQVVFVRTPSSGVFWLGELNRFPRQSYWDKLLSNTNTKGIHFKDYPPISNYTCPEFSHLSPTDAIDFTRHFVSILKSEHGWNFSGK